MEEEVQQSLGEESAKVWQCGESYQWPLPAPEGDPWQILLTPILEKDKARCEAWKDEVQNLLIFAGLFSAVVTAFIIETYKGLQQDSGDVVVLLLSRIANGLGNSSSSSAESISASLPPFSPAPSIVRVNIFFFISLILSLATVLIGIVSLQWLREHQAHTGSLTPQNTFAAVHMRSEALEKWRVPEIFSALPLILQSALILFFVGLIDFLQSINVRVLIPVASTIGLTLVFFLLTTTLPTLQAFILHHPNPNLNDEVPVPCPYKSPQSRAFRRVITSSKLVFHAMSLTFATIYWMIIRLCLLPGQILESSIYDLARSYWKTVFGKLSNITTALRPFDQQSQDGFGYMTHQIFEYWGVKSSFEFDLRWLTIRDNYFQSTCRPESWLYSNRLGRHNKGAIYDAVQGLCKELNKDDVNMNADFESPIFMAYHCALDRSAINQLQGDEQIYEAQTWTAYLTMLLGYDQLTSFSPFPEVAAIPRGFLREETSFVLLNFAHSRLYDLELPSPQLSRHLAEISFRLLGYLYSRPHLTSMPGDSSSTVPFNAEELYVMKIFNDKDQPFTTQWALTIDLYFRVFDDPNAVNIDFELSFQHHPFIQDYIRNFWREVNNEIRKENIHSDTLKQIQQTFNLIDVMLRKFLKNNNRKILDCVLNPAALYAQSCRQLLPDHYVLKRSTDALIPALAQCKDIMIPSDNHCRRRIVTHEDEQLPLTSEKWWEVLLPSDRESHLSHSHLSHSISNGQHRSSSYSMEVIIPHQRSSSQLDLENHAQNSVRSNR